MYAQWVKICDNLDNKSLDFCKQGSKSVERFINTEAPTMLVAGVAGILSVLLVAMVIFAKVKHNTSPILFKPCFHLVLATVDFSMDSIFVDRCWSGLNYYSVFSQVRIPALIFLTLPILLNIFISGGLLNRALQNDDTRAAMKENPLPVVILFLFSFLHTEALSFLGSSALPVLNIPLSKEVKERLAVTGLVNNIFEDIPQLVIQVFVFVDSGSSFYSLSGASIVTSVMSLLLGIVKRSLFCCFSRADRKATGSSQPVQRSSELHMNLLSAQDLQKEKMRESFQTEIGSDHYGQARQLSQGPQFGKSKNKRRIILGISLLLIFIGLIVIIDGATGSNASSSAGQGSPIITAPTTQSPTPKPAP